VSKFLAEIRRRKLIQTFVPYLGFVWLLLQIVSVITPMLNWHPLVNTFFAVVLFAGIPVMLYLSWYFDFTMQGLLPIADSDSGKIRPFGVLRWALLLAITAGSGILSYQYFYDIKAEYAKIEDGLTQQIEASSIAVLPFKDNSPDQDQAFLAQGLAEEITSLLGKTDGLKVAASSSTSILNDKGLDPVTIARRLDVQTILTGSVRKTGDQLKIRVELVHALDGKVLWTETFARKFIDIFAVETEIARSTVNLLQDTYIESGTITNPATTKSIDAYVIYLKGREQYRKQTTESIKEARKLFEQAIGLDPEYAQAYVALADTIVLLAEGPERFGVLKVDIAASLAKQNLEKAIVRQPELPMAFAVLGYIPFMLNTPEDSLSFFDKAIELNPNLAIARVWKSLALKDLQRHDESLQELEIAYQLDPLSLTIMHNLGFKYSKRSRDLESQKIYKQLILDYPESPHGFAGLADATFEVGNYAMSLKYWKQAYKISPENEEYQENILSCLSALGMAKQFKTFASNTVDIATILLLEQQYQSLFKHMDFTIGAAPDDPWLKFEAAWYHLLVGDPKKASVLLLQVEKGVSENDKFFMPLCSPAIEISWAYFFIKQTDDAQKILDKCSKKLREARFNNINQIELEYLEARIFALQNNHQEALDSLSGAVKNGLREWWIEKDLLLSNLKNFPEFQRQISIINDDLAKQRKEALKSFEK
jgi:TolB-like protein/Tfp pilus assembly protein PilF